MQLVLSTQQWLGALLTAVVALVVYAAGVRSARASQRYEQLNDASVRLSEAAVHLASAVSAAERGEGAVDVPHLRTLHEQVRGAATAVWLSSRSRQVRLLGSVIVRTSWQMRHHVANPDEPRDHWPWWRFEPEHPHADARRCAGCPVGVRPPAAIMGERTRDAATVRRMNELVEEFQFAVGTEVARSPYSLGQGVRRVLAWGLDRVLGTAAERPDGVSWHEAARAWWRQVPTLLRQRGVPRRHEVDDWLRHYGFVGFDDPKPEAPTGR